MQSPHQHHLQPLPTARRPNDGSLICYCIVGATASLLLLAILATTVSVVKACLVAGAVAVVFGCAGCVARLCAADDRAAPAALPTAVAMAAPRAGAACGLVGAAIDALPAFAYARLHSAGTCAREGSGSTSKCGRCALCSVCLEDVEAGEMVRQLPACGHLFHVGCIDMWLHSHATCPLCRCDVSPESGGVKATATAAADPRDGALPPV